ncbi:MAG: AEC family transporter [Candidatus Marinimicrobia bacterium]|nr:AEC family transporter [Candidatus Neomarinimicrobiota bacterium]
MQTANTLAPIFLIVVVGFLLRQTGFIAGPLVSGLNRLTFWVGLPCLLFLRVAEADLAGTAVSGLLGLLLAATLVTVAGGLGFARVLGLARPARGALAQGAFRGNLAYVGLPVIAYWLADSGLPAAEAVRLETLAVVCLGTLVVLYNVLAVWVLMPAAPAGRSRFDNCCRRVFGVLRNPLILACLAGALWRATDWGLPVAPRRGLAALGQMALPLSLLAIGASLDFRMMRGRFGPVLTGALIKVMLGPLVAVALAGWFGVTGPERVVGLLLLACPTAVASYVMAEQMGADATIAGGIVLLSTLLSMGSLAWVLACGAATL